MENMKRLLHTTLLLLIIFILFPQKILASSNFTTDSLATYTVEQSGNTKAEFAITLTSITEKVYADSYKMSIGLNDVSNLAASDQSGKIKTELQKNENNTVVTFYLNKKALGLGSKSSFKFAFDTKSIAAKAGESWEINIPGISNPDEFQTFNTSVKVPDSFGQASYIKPASNSLNFTKEQLQNSAISIAFGKKRTYEYELTYHLKNPNLFRATSKIALPSDTNYQKISLTSINPKPKKITQDMDGNWIAEYPLNATQSMDVVAKGRAEIGLVPEKTTLTDAQKLLYTRATKYWPTEDEKIRKVARDLKSAREIYEYVAKTLKYDFTRVTKNKPRLGGARVLDNPSSAVCLEFTDLFISLARANGIPAREVNGFAYTQNSPERPLSLIADVLHAWPEYYDTDKKSWIMVDPTWAQTTGGTDYFDVLDFDHLAFVRKGEADSYPIPAGGYKSFENKKSQDIKVNPIDQNIPNQQNAEIKVDLKSWYIAGLPLKTKMEIVNVGTTALPPQKFHVASSSLSPNNQELSLGAIPPFGSETVEVRFDNRNFLTNKLGLFTIAYAGKEQSHKIKIAPFFHFFSNE